MHAALFLLIPAIILLALIALHWYFHIPASDSHKTPADYHLSFKELAIPTVKQKRLLAWFIPAQPEAAVVIIVHGWGSRSAQMLPLALPFRRQGLNVILFDARSHGSSDRDTFASLPRFAEDIQKVINYTRNELKLNNKLILLGHSLGGSASLYAASKRHDIDAVISIAAFAHPRLMMQRALHRLPNMLVQPE